MEKINKQPVVGTVLLVHVIIVIFILTLQPFNFQNPEAFRFRLDGYYPDIIRNIILFIPVGFFFRLAKLKPSQGYALNALFLGASISLVIESCQLFLPDRYPAISDILANGIGAWAGLKIHDVIKKKTSNGDMLKVIALNLPLTGLVYLVTPLLMIHAFSTGTDPQRIWLMVFPGAIGSMVIASIYSYRADIRNAVSIHGVALFSCAWFLIGGGYIFAYYPAQVVSIVIIIGLLTWVFIRRADKIDAPDKRFEHPTIRKIIPLFLVYIFLLTIMAPEIEFDIWSWSIGINEYPRSFSLEYKSLTSMKAIRFIEFTMAFVLLGYIAAEAQGRSLKSYRKALLNVLFITFFSALICETIRGFHSQLAFSLTEWVVAIIAGCYGGCLYLIILRGIVGPRPGNSS
jgi:glycopeptide antibiotics resistance protein